MAYQKKKIVIFDSKQLTNKYETKKMRAAVKITPVPQKQRTG